MTSGQPVSRLRIGDAERERAVTALGEHFAAGRLDRAEHDERADAALSAKVWDDLTVLFHDLPPPVVGPPSGHPAWPPPRRRPRRLPVLLLALLAVAALAEAPWPLLAVLVVLTLLRLGAWLAWRSASAGGTRQGDRHARGSWRAPGGSC